MNLQYPDLEEVLLIHALVIGRAKSRAGVRDFALLYSAIERPKATFGGKDLYQNVFIKAAALLQSLCLNHPFTDGNKRTSWATTHKFLWDNNIHLKSRKMETVRFIFLVFEERIDLKGIAIWLKSHSTHFKR